MIRFLKNFFSKLRNVANNNPKQTFIKSVVLMLVVIILFFIVQYDTNMLEKKQKKITKIITEIDTDIKISSAEYNALISPVRLKQLSNFYLPHFKDIRPSSTVKVKDIE